MATDDWAPAAPRGALRPMSRSELPTDEPAEISGVAALDQRWSGIVLPDGSGLADLDLQGCDLAGLVTRSSRLRRAQVVSTRLRGVTWAAGHLEDVVLSDVVTTDLVLRFSTLRRVVVRDCDLTAVDLTETTLDRVLLQRCRLPGARFAHANASRLRIEGCDLAGVSGAEHLRGASIHPDDLISLGPSLAWGLGITVEA